MAVPSLSVSYSQHEIVWRWAAAVAATSPSIVPPSAATASGLTEEGQNQEKKKKSAVALPWDFGSANSDLVDGVARRFDCSGWYSNWRGEKGQTGH